MSLLGAWSAALASAAVLGLFLARLGLRGRLFGDALAIGATLGATMALMLAPFDLRANPFHFPPAIVAFVFAGAPEEAIKLLGAFALLRGHFRARDRRDVVLASGALGLGFATLENLFYLANAGGAWATLAGERALTAGPFHVLLGLAGGYAAARAPASFAGAALVVAAGLGLAAIHGAYDYAVLAGAAPPEVLRVWGLDPLAVLRGLMFSAEAAAALAAALALRFSPGEPAPFRRWIDAPVVGWGLTGILAGGAVLALLAGLGASYAFDTIDVLAAALIFATLPFAVGMMAAPRPSKPPLRLRRAVAAVAVVGVGSALVGAVVAGPAGWTRLDMTRQVARGARFASQRDYPRAAESFSRAIADAPRQAEPLQLRAEVYVAARRLDAALADLDAAVRLAPDKAALYAQRADVQRQRNAPAAALADLNVALRLAPEDVTLLAQRAQAKLETGDSKGAYDDLAEASRRAPDAAVVRDVFAAWDVDSGDFDAAVRDLNARLHENPGDADATFRRGRAWFYKNEFARADADFASAEAGGLYPALWRFLAQTRLSAPAPAGLRTRLAAAPTDWPAPVARMLLGEIDLAAARAQASDAGERCEADFYFAASRLGVDASEASADRLKAALAECPTAFVEYEGAKAELRRLALFPGGD